MAKKTIEELSSRVDTLKAKAKGLAEDADLATRRKAKKAVRRAQRQVRSITTRAELRATEKKASEASSAKEA